MKIQLNPNRHREGVVIWLVIAVLVFAIVIIGIMAYLSVKTIHKVVPCPPPDQDNHGSEPIIGDTYAGGIVTGYTNQYHEPWVDSTNYGAAPQDVPNTSNLTAYIFAADRPDVPVWTNCIWSGPWDELTNQIGTNGLPIEQWTNGTQPRQRFYNFAIQTNQ